LDLPASATPEGVGEQAIAATVYSPAAVDARDVGVLVCWPGGSYGRDYWNIQLPGRDGYSFAEHMTARGFVVIAADPLGVGDSGRPEDGTSCTYDALADAAHAAVDLIRARLSDGSLVERLPPIAAPRIVGVGHSMGGGLVVLQQARWASYDAIAILGYTHGAKARAVPSGDDAARRATAIEQAKGFWGDQWEARYGVVDKAPHQDWLNGPDAPADIVAADNANAVIWAAEPYVDALHVGYTAAYAADVTAPVMIAFGEFDIAERPRDEVAFYEHADDITLFVLAGSYHCHNFQDGRVTLWNRLATWASEVAASS
jgi:alpha-beta hydrolase superfamily lysophospholipase